MKLSKRQEQIIAVVKEHQPVSGERISDILAVHVRHCVLICLFNTFRNFKSKSESWLYLRK